MNVHFSDHEIINTFNTCNGVHIFEFLFYSLVSSFQKTHCAGAILLTQFAWELHESHG